MWEAFQAAGRPHAHPGRRVQGTGLWVGEVHPLHGVVDYVFGGDDSGDARASLAWFRVVCLVTMEVHAHFWCLVWIRVVGQNRRLLVQLLTYTGRDIFLSEAYIFVLLHLMRDHGGIMGCAHLRARHPFKTIIKAWTGFGPQDLGRFVLGYWAVHAQYCGARNTKVLPVRRPCPADDKHIQNPG